MDKEAPRTIAGIEIESEDGSIEQINAGDDDVNAWLFQLLQIEESARAFGRKQGDEKLADDFLWFIRNVAAGRLKGFDAKNPYVRMDMHERFMTELSALRWEQDAEKHIARQKVAIESGKQSARERHGDEHIREKRNLRLLEKFDELVRERGPRRKNDGSPTDIELAARAHKIIFPGESVVQKTAWAKVKRARDIRTAQSR